jgi:ribosome biogenesis GTPase / thiamine phosphate phosphatase
MSRGTVIKSTGSHYLIKSHEDSKIYTCRIVGKFRLENLKLTNPIAVGDIVGFNKTDETIVEIVPRKNYVVRQSPRKKHFVHLMASNIDQALVVVTMREPNLKPGFIDRFLLMTEPYDIPVVIVFNKCDLHNEEDELIYRYLKRVYEAIPHTVTKCSALTGEGISELKVMLRDKQTLVSGQSGVGKSTLINTIQANLGLRTDEISDYSGKGQHTTTFAEMFELDFGGTIIDTPGIKTLAFNHFDILDVAHNFKEFFRLSVNCKFDNCTHRNEPKCAVKAAVEAEEVSELRYQNYLQIIQEVEDQNYWERVTDI